LLASCLLKKSITPSFRGKSVSEIAFFPQELALAKPVAHDEIVFEPFFNGLLGAFYG